MSVLRLLTDQNLHGDIVRGLLHRLPTLDLVRVHDAGLSEADDETILAWAAFRDRVLVTHDRKTMPKHAYHRVALGLPMSGVFLVDVAMPRGRALDELQLAVEELTADECRDAVTFFPL